MGFIDGESNPDWKHDSSFLVDVVIAKKEEY
jgi:hypothetical protein